MALESRPTVGCPTPSGMFGEDCSTAARLRGQCGGVCLLRGGQPARVGGIGLWLWLCGNHWIAVGRRRRDGGIIPAIAGPAQPLLATRPAAGSETWPIRADIRAVGKPIWPLPQGPELRQRIPMNAGANVHSPQRRVVPDGRPGVSCISTAQGSPNRCSRYRTSRPVCSRSACCP